MTRRVKPPKLGTVWVAVAHVQYIDEATMKWVTVRTCSDTPNAIANAVEKSRLAYPGKTLWVRSDVSGRYLP